MTKNANGISLKKSCLKTDGKPNLPSPDKLVFGELAVNYAEGVETISTKNESGDVVTFSSDDYFKNQYLAWEKGTGTGSAKLIGNGGTASGNYSVAEGYETIATGHSSHAEGYATSATTSMPGVHAEGNRTYANSGGAHAEGTSTSATSMGAHAEGYTSEASGNYSHAEGNHTIANQQSAHAEGTYTTASGLYSHSEGEHTVASGQSSHAEGNETIANGSCSHVEGNHTIANNYFEHASGIYNVSNKSTDVFGSSGNTLFSVGNGTDDIARHNAFEIRQNGDIYIVSGSSDIKLQDYLGGGGSITVDQVLDNTTSASTNPVSSKAVYDAVTDNELVWTNAYVAISGAVSSHTSNTDIHVTAADKTAWNGAVTNSHTHSNKSALDSITGNVGTMAYEAANSYSSATEVSTALGNKLEASDVADFFDDAKYELSGTTHVINFYNDNTIKATIDAEPFIVDGMVESVSAVTSGNTTVLDIKWNTAAGGQETIIDIGDIFEADNYYQKSQTSGATELATAFGDINDIIGSGFTSSSITDVIIENEEITSAALTDLDNRKLDATAYTPTDLSNYYTKSEIDTMIGNIETLLAAI